MSSSQDITHYKVLGVPYRASKRHIRVCFMRKAKETHPDQSGDDGATFRLVQEAWECLSDSEQRISYDAQLRLSGKFDESYKWSSLPKRGERMPELSFKVTLTMEEMFHGCSKHLELKRQTMCTHCDGEGAVNWSDCHSCNSQGQMMVRHELRGQDIVTEMVQSCVACCGSGRIITCENDMCTQCKGAPFAIETARVDILIPAGTRPFQTLTFSDLGHQEVGNPLRSTVEVRVHSQLHSIFEFGLSSTDLLIKHTITLAEAFAGFEFLFTHLSGKMYKLKSLNESDMYRKLICPDDIFVVPNLGFITQGRLLVQINITFPRNLLLSKAGAESFAEPLRPHTVHKHQFQSNVQLLNAGDNEAAAECIVMHRLV